MIKKIGIITLLIFSTIGLIACGQNVQENPYEITPRDDTFTYYQSTVMNEDNHLYVFGRHQDRNYNHVELILGQTIQGLFAQDRVTFYLSNNDIYDRWLNYISETYDLTHSTVELDEMVNMYQDKVDDPGYILYDYQENYESLNVANSLVGLTGWVAIDKSLEAWAQTQELALKLDVSDKSERWLFDTYHTELNNEALIQLRTDIPHLRDYGVAFNYLYFYQERSTTAAISFRGDIHNWAQNDAPLFGWGPGAEDSHVGIGSRNGHFTIPSDYAYNMTVFSALTLREDTFLQPNEKETIEVDSNKHYITIVRSDGDNIQTWYNYFPFNEKDMAAERGDFKMGWSIQPSLYDLGPMAIKHAYDNADINDYFVAAVSGFGYMYPSMYPNLSDFLGSLDLYLKRTDLSIVQILDSGPYDDVVEYYSQVEHLKGAMYMYGEKYIGGGGEIFWSSNGKPFVSFRESLWDSIPQDVASRINQYETNPNHISGYTLINLHPWSHSYQDVETMVAALADHVVIVSPETFFDLIIQNVPKENQTP